MHEGSKDTSTEQVQAIGHKTKGILWPQRQPRYDLSKVDETFVYEIHPASLFLGGVSEVVCTCICSTAALPEQVGETRASGSGSTRRKQRNNHTDKVSAAVAEAARPVSLVGGFERVFSKIQKRYHAFELSGGPLERSVHFRA